MSQQTALDWYMEKMNEYFDDASIHCGLYKEGKIYEQAKAMEKEQIINAHGLKYYDITEEVINGEQYYKETYNK
jgi:hypothetical protein